MRAPRITRIVHTIGRYGLDEFLPERGLRPLRWLFAAAFFWRDRSRPRAERLRLALESLGPVFVKFGQLLSVRPDLIAEDVVEELAKLQDNVPPFAWEEVAATLERAYGRPRTQVFATFDAVPIASASVAQVHFATLPDGREVAVKILRPGIRSVIGERRGAAAHARGPRRARCCPRAGACARARWSRSSSTPSPTSWTCCARRPTRAS